MSPIHSHKGKPGEPGEPGEPGTGGGGAGGRGGRGGEGGSGYYDPHNRKREIMSLFALFMCVLAISLLIFIVQNNKKHNDIIKADYYACVQNQQIAKNQRRVITALLTLEGDEQNAGKEHIKDIALLQVALKSVPRFNCTKGG